MNVHFETSQRLKEKIRNGEPTLGLFVRIPAMQVLESLGNTGIDFIALDAEHGPFGSADLDRCILAGRSVGLPVLVRVRELSPGTVLETLDMGAAGIIAPHVQNVEQAQQLVSACRYDGGRGFSTSTRAAEYGNLGGEAFRAASDRGTIVIAQIEDKAGLASVNEIASEPGIDALLIGRADLAVSLGAAGQGHEQLQSAVDTILVAGQRAQKTIALFVTNMEDAARFRNAGASLFIGSTDQDHLQASVTTMVSTFREQQL